MNIKLLKTPRATQQTRNSICLETIVLFTRVVLKHKNYPLYVHSALLFCSCIAREKPKQTE